MKTSIIGQGVVSEKEVKAEVRSVIGKLIFDDTVSKGVCVARATLLKAEIDDMLKALTG